MLLEFTVENYRSFYRKKTLVLEADKALKECTETNLFDNNTQLAIACIALTRLDFPLELAPYSASERSRVYLLQSNKFVSDMDSGIIWSVSLKNGYSGKQHLVLKSR